MKLLPYQWAAIVGSSILMLSGLLRFQCSGSPKELAIGILYFLANLLIFCL
jgi:hypothetical protein